MRSFSSGTGRMKSLNLPSTTNHSTAKGQVNQFAFKNSYMYMSHCHLTPKLCGPCATATLTITAVIPTCLLRGKHCTQVVIHTTTPNTHSHCCTVFTTSSRLIHAIWHTKSTGELMTSSVPYSPLRRMYSSLGNIRRSWRTPRTHHSNLREYRDMKKEEKLMTLMWRCLHNKKIPSTCY